MLHPAQEGHYWKVPFVWEPGCPVPGCARRLAFTPARAAWLPGAIAATFVATLDESDHRLTQSRSSMDVATELLALSRRFVVPEDCWLAAHTDRGDPVGMALGALFPGCERDGRPEATIFYIGVLPSQRGRGYIDDLLAGITRALLALDPWRIFCDTGASNHPMIAAFRRAGYLERDARQRPLE